MDAEKLEMCREYAAARPAASGEHYLGPDFEAALNRGPRWLPRLAGRFVRNPEDPQEGFVSKAEAINAARAFCDACRTFLASH